MSRQNIKSCMKTTELKRFNTPNETVQNCVSINVSCVHHKQNVFFMNILFSEMSFKTQTL